MNTSDSPYRGRLKSCPAWCETSHGEPLNPVHRGFVAEVNRGEYHVIITVMSDPRGPGPVVAIDAWDLAAETVGGVTMSPGEASGLAVIMTALGRADVAGYLRHAVGLLSEPGPEAGL